MDNYLLIKKLKIYFIYIYIMYSSDSESSYYENFGKKKSNKKWWIGGSIVGVSLIVFLIWCDSLYVQSIIEVFFYIINL